jgi:multidrug efflux system membrane fusion protein
VVPTLGVLCALLGAGCSGESKSAPGGPGGGGRERGGGGRGGGAAVFPVEVTSVSSRPVEYSVTAVGSVEAFEIVQVTARVPGAVEKIHFREGSQVRKGDLLLEIEPDRYRLGVEEARAAEEKARAALAEAEAGLARREGANEKTSGLIPGEEVDTWRTRVLTARAEVTARAAALKLAERNAHDAAARAPFAGTIQTRDVQTGEYVRPGDLLTTLVRRDPMLLRFRVPEVDAARISPRMEARFRVRNAEKDSKARIVHVAESADPTSRMVAITAEIEDADGHLRPGTFAEVTVPIGAPVDAAVIPETAVRPSERGFLAYVVEQGVARERILTLGLRTPDGLVEVKGGLAPAESLVVRGAEALRDGARVRVAAPATATGETKPGDAAPSAGDAVPGPAAPGSSPPGASKDSPPAGRSRS